MLLCFFFAFWKMGWWGGFKELIVVILCTCYFVGTLFLYTRVVKK